jgi:hypothetical protein
MKLVAAIVFSLICCSLAAGECTTVESNKFQPSYDRVRITVLLNGKARNNVILDIIGVGGAPHFSAFIKRGGAADLPLLAPGNYWVIAHTTVNRAAELCLDVEMSPKGETSSFSMVLLPNQRIASKRIQEFCGILVDANDARIAGAKIELFKMGFLQVAPVLQAKSEEDGVFSGLLADGQYLVIFTKYGFQTVAMILEVAKSEKPRDLRIAMQVQSMAATTSLETRR